MQKQTAQKTEGGEHAQGAPRESSAVGQLTTSGSIRRLHIVIPPLPPRTMCLVDRKSRAARHATEFALWQASGGDFLRSSLAAEFIRVASGL